MKYRVFALLGVLALSAGAILQAQDYDDIYYDASKSTGTVKTKAMKPEKTVTVYGEVPDKYKVAAQSNYRIERDEDEYNRHGAAYEYVDKPSFEVDINGDTIYFDNDSVYAEAFANTRLIERFYNPDVVILSTDDELVELYYNESPTVNLIIGSDWGYSTYGWGFDYYSPWYSGFGYPWWHYTYSPYRYYYWGLDWGFGWPYHGWYRWHTPYYWSYWEPRPWSNVGWGHWGSWHNSWWAGNGSHNRGVTPRHWGSNGNSVRAGLAGNRNTRDRVSNNPTSRNHVSAAGGGTNRSTGMGSRPGYAGNRNSGNMGSRRTSGVTSRSSVGTGGVSRSSGTRSYGGGSSYGGSRSYGGGSSSGGSRSYGGSSSSSSRSSGSSYGGGSYSGGSSRGGSSGGGGSHGGSSGGGGRRR